MGVLQDGLIPSLVQQCATRLGSPQGDSAAFVRFTDALLGVVEQLIVIMPPGAWRCFPAESWSQSDPQSLC
jgi:hypothetical protein